MKRILLLLTVLLNFQWTSAQQSTSIAVQFYVDANNNCAYNPGEQLLYNVAFQLQYLQANNNLGLLTNSGTVSACGATTLYPWGQAATANNTLTIISSGVNAVLSCNNYLNLPYNSNTLQYLPVSLGTSNLGAQLTSITYYSSTGISYYPIQSSAAPTIGICSNLGSDSLVMNIEVGNLLSCTNSGTTASRTYSLFFDGTYYDQLNFVGGVFSSGYVTGINNLSNGFEFYTGSNTYLTLYPQLPSTFSVLGTHTLEVKSNAVYNPNMLVNKSVIINSIPCTKIRGRFFTDCNNNCLYDAGDSYGVGSGAYGYVYNGQGTNISFLPNWMDGSFSIYLPTAAAYSLTQLPAPSYNYTACSNNTITIPAAATTNTFLFGYRVPANSQVDPLVYLYRLASTSAIISPGVGAVFAITHPQVWSSPCNLPANNPGKTKVLLPKFLNYVSTVNGAVPSLVQGPTMDTLIWIVPNFSVNNTSWSNPFSSFSVVVSATAVPNTSFTVLSTIYPAVDVNTANNVAGWSRVIGGPFDPNGKWTEATGLKANGDIPFGTQELGYKIGFQNIGNAPAINVLTLDTIDSNLDLNTLKVLQSSFPVSTVIDKVSRAVYFHFNGINLPGALTNEPASHGFVKYSIKLKAGVPVNTVLKNRAHNYFDFNEPVATNQTVNKLTIITSIAENAGKALQIKAQPNPFNTAVLIESTEVLHTIRVFNIAGVLVKDLTVNSHSVELQMDELPNAVYLIRTVDVNGSPASIKVIKD